MTRKMLTIISSLLLSAGCYHATIETGAAPSGKVIENQWAASFIGGLVPPSTVESAAKCPNGVSKVETQMSFLNMLANVITFGLYSPMTLTVTCGTGKMATLPVVRGSIDVAESLQRAARASFELATPVRLELPQ